jgi:hypothetical protein
MGQALLAKVFGVDFIGWFDGLSGSSHNYQVWQSP